MKNKRQKFTITVTRKEFLSLPMAIRRRTLKKQAAKMLSLNGKTQNVSMWAREFGLNPRLVRERIRRQAWSLEKALNLRGAIPERDTKPAQSIGDILRKALQ